MFYLRKFTEPTVFSGDVARKFNPNSSPGIHREEVANLLSKSSLKCFKKYGVLKDRLKEQQVLVLLKRVGLKINMRIFMLTLPPALERY